MLPGICRTSWIPRRPPLPRLPRAVGHRTIHAGKWHLGRLRTFDLLASETLRLRWARGLTVERMAGNLWQLRRNGPRGLPVRGRHGPSNCCGEVKDQPFYCRCSAARSLMRPLNPTSGADGGSSAGRLRAGLTEPVHGLCSDRSGWIVDWGDFFRGLGRARPAWRTRLVIFSSDNVGRRTSISPMPLWSLAAVVPVLARGRNRSLHEGGIRGCRELNERQPAGAPAGQINNDSVVCGAGIFCRLLCRTGGRPIPRERSVSNSAGKVWPLLSAEGPGLSAKPSDPLAVAVPGVLIIPGTRYARILAGPAGAVEVAVQSGRFPGGAVPYSRRSSGEIQNNRRRGVSGDCPCRPREAVLAWHLVCHPGGLEPAGGPSRRSWPGTSGELPCGSAQVTSRHARDLGSLDGGAGSGSIIGGGCREGRRQWRLPRRSCRGTPLGPRADRTGVSRVAGRGALPKSQPRTKGLCLVASCSAGTGSDRK